MWLSMSGVGSLTLQGSAFIRTQSSSTSTPILVRELNCASWPAWIRRVHFVNSLCNIRVYIMSHVFVVLCSSGYLGVSVKTMHFIETELSDLLRDLSSEL